ncbi:MAG TPA: toprim domain-containing protein [Thermoplasmata archaeon]|nr:toprim domain-containing protein [Thermoplasmata archaeon]
MARIPDRAAAWAEFLEVWETMLEESAQARTAFVVEGENDVRALRRIGIDGAIVPIHRGQRLAAVARHLDVVADRVLILTDWDTEGGHLAHRLAELLAPGRVEVDLALRRRLARLLRGELVHVEGLYGWARRMAERQGAPLDHFRPMLVPPPHAVASGRAPGAD